MIETSLILAFIAVAFAVWANQTKPRVHFDDERTRDKDQILKAFREAPTLKILDRRYGLIKRFLNKYNNERFAVWDDIKYMQDIYDWKREQFIAPSYSMGER